MAVPPGQVGMTYSFGPPLNFLGLPPEESDLETSRVLLLPVPYEATTSYGGGTRSGPQAILAASTQVELYDREFGGEMARRWGIHTLPPLAPEGAGPEAMVAVICEAVMDYGSRGKLLGILGGEHTVSVGVARALSRLHGDFVTVQLDAHADLRDEYEGTPYSHACAARRILNHSPLVQFGIRSLDVTEAAFIQDNPGRVTTVFADEMQGDKSYLTRLADRVRGQAVYLTVDLDVLDPAALPAVGTPEPGGLFWYDLLEIIRVVAAQSRVLAFDVVELAPIPGCPASDFTAAKLVYKIINAVLSAQAK